ncbi:glycoside hydrolase superfamily [Russula dissimulans]|nr:glycoside hydrolase superfamily [Russula dissimulans]
MPALFQSITSLTFALALIRPLSVLAFNNVRLPSRYWGQNLCGETHPTQTTKWQKTLSFYCQDNSVDVFSLAFLTAVSDAGGLPSINLANMCNNSVFPGTALLDCSFLAPDIEACQAKGKIVTLSICGAFNDVSLVSDSQAKQFADTIWNIFLGGSSSTRPFGSAVLDGVNLNLEGGSLTYWPTFVTQLRSHASSANKTYYITAALQCPYPDAYLGHAINTVGFDALYVQFYENYCGLQAFNELNEWDFVEWDHWAKTTSPNKMVKIYLGAPAGPLAARSGYVDVDTLARDALKLRELYSSFGGVMLWDASQAYANGDFAASIKRSLALSSSGSVSSAAVPSPTPSASKQNSTTITDALSSPSSPTGGSCCGATTWVVVVANNDEVPGVGYTSVPAISL